MAGRRTSFKIPGLTAWVDNIKNTVSQETARDIVKDLQFLGPWYSGEFSRNWTVKLGQTSIGATKERNPKSWFKLPPGQITTKPGGRDQMPGPISGVPRPQGRKSIFYTIGNPMKYRNIAMDLEPGRWDPSKNNTAGQDWFLLYVESGLLRRRLEQSTQRVANLPKIKGFKGLKDTRGELGL